MYWSRHRDPLALGTQERRAKVLYSMSKCFRATSIGLLNMMNGSKAANPFAILLVSPTRFRTSLMRNCTYCWLAVLDKACFYCPCGGLYGWTFRLLSEVDALCSSPASGSNAVGQFEPEQVFILR